MDKHEKNKLLLHSSLRDVLERLNQGVSGVIVLVDNNDTVHGILTDGDVRRALLNGATLESPASRYMNTSFTHGTADDSREDLIKLLSDKIRHLPVLDQKRRLVDLVNWVDIWRKPVMEPHLGGNELKYIADCITSNWISSQGSYVKNFEREFAAFHNEEFALTTTNGTSALHLALIALGVGPGDEVIVPDVTFAATANVVLHCGAKPVLVDVKPDTWTMDPEHVRLALTEHTKAIMPVHLYGHPCDMDPLLDIARARGLFIVEDCAEALGARYKGRLVGTMGDVGCFSFFSNKIITTGEGGMVLTRNQKLAERMALYRDHGMTPARRYWHPVAGFNYRMTNMQAAIGLAQLEQIGTFCRLREAIAQRYQANLDGVDGISLQPRAVWASPVMWLFTVLLPGYQEHERALVIERLARCGVEARPFFPPLHLQPPYASTSDNFKTANKLGREGLSLPSGISLSPEDIDRICSILLETITRYPAASLQEAV